MSELQQQPIVSKINATSTYSLAANYWAPLDETDNEDNEEDNVEYNNNITNDDAQIDLRSTIRAWINQQMGRNKPFQRIPSTMVVDSGATSHFVRPEENLPITGESCKVVYLPNGTSIKATHTTTLPFKELSPQARKADVLPGLRPNTLISVGKLANADYTTIFHPRGDGVTVHKKGTLKITQWRKPVLQGWRDANGLWRLSRQDEHKRAVQKQKKNEVAANVYSLPSITQTIRYLHAAAGFPTKDSWVKAIKNGNYDTWPGLTVDNVKKHFPESVETQKGHMKKQRQNVRSTKQVVDLLSEDEELTRSVTKHSL